MTNIFMSILVHLSVLSVSTTIITPVSPWETISIHELLKSQGLPAGLFPKNGVRSYKVDREGFLQVYLDAPCVAKFETRVFFQSVVSANLSYGGLHGVEGLSQLELFLWLPVKEITVSDPSSNLILFDIGMAHKHLSLSLSLKTPLCAVHKVGSWRIFQQKS